MTDNTFNDNFKNKKFAKARDAFLQMNDDDQVSCLEALFQQSMNAITPAAISVLFRKLHPGKTFEDFRAAHLPPEEFCKPQQAGGEEFKNFFPVPTRVFNAVDVSDPSNVVSVGLTWTRNDEEKELMNTFLSQIKENGANKIRVDRIEKVADKSDSGIYLTESDDNFGSQF